MIQMPGTQSDSTSAITVPPAALPEPAPAPEIDAPDPALSPDGQALDGGDEPVQVAGVAGALKGLLGKALRKGEKAAEKGAEAATDAEKAATAAAPPAPPSVPPAAPQPAAPPPAPKPRRIIRTQDKAPQPDVPMPDEQKAAAVASEMTSGAPRAIEPGRTTWRNFRSDKLQTTDDIKALIDNAAEEAGGHMEARRGVVTNEQTAEEAKQYGLDELLRRKPAESWNAAQLSAGREILLELSDRISKAATVIDSGKASAEDMVAFRQMLGQHAAVQETLQGAVAEAGRALQIMRSVTAAGGRLRAREVLDTLDEMGGESVARKLAQQVVEAAGDPVKVGDVTRKGAFARTGDALTEIWINGLLSGPTTHVVNSLSNALMLAMQVPERAVAGAIGKLHAGDRVELGEAGALLSGLFNGWQDALSAAARVARTGEPMGATAKIENANRKAFTAANLGVDPESGAGKALDLFGEYYVRLPGRALMTEDAMFKSLGYRSELSAQAWRQATREGLEGEAFTQRVNDIIANPPEDLHIAADQTARYLTLQDTLSGDNWVEVLGQAGAKIASLPMGKYILPFIKTPTNAAEYVLERTPMGLTMKSVRDDIAAGGAKRDMAVAKMTMGSTIAGIAATYAWSGQITGRGPDDPKIRAEMQANGWQANSVRMGDKWVSYNRLDPVGMLIGSAADAMDIMRYSDDEDAKAAVAAAVAVGFGESLMNKTYLTGLSDVLDVIKNNDAGDSKLQRGVNYGAKFAGSWVPAWVNFTRQVGDDVVREPSKADPLTQTIDTLRNRTPGLSKDVPPKLDLFGEPVRVESFPMNPMKSATPKDDPVLEEIQRNRTAITTPGSKVTVDVPGVSTTVRVDLLAVDHSGWLLHDYRQKVGELARPKAERVIKSAEYRNPKASPEERSKLLLEAFSDARAEALTWLARTRPEIRQAAQEAFTEGGSQGFAPGPTDNLFQGAQ